MSDPTGLAPVVKEVERGRRGPRSTFDSTGTRPVGDIDETGQPDG